MTIGLRVVHELPINNLAVHDLMPYSKYIIIRRIIENIWYIYLVNKQETCLRYISQPCKIYTENTPGQLMIDQKKWNTLHPVKQQGNYLEML